MLRFKPKTEVYARYTTVKRFGKPKNVVQLGVFEEIEGERDPEKKWGFKALAAVDPAQFEAAFDVIEY